MKIGDTINVAYKQLLKKVMRVLEEHNRKCYAEIGPQQRELYARKHHDWKERIAKLPELDSEMP